MKKIFYTRENCPCAPDNYNRGERVEWRVGYELTGTPSARNNKPAHEGGDVGDWQVKSPRASLTGKDLCKGYIFGFAEEEFYYTMTIEEFEAFVEEFSSWDHDSHTGKTKLRIKGDSKIMRAWLEARA